jgi:hypothetical protein
MMHIVPKKGYFIYRSGTKKKLSGQLQFCLFPYRKPYFQITEQNMLFSHLIPVSLYFHIDFSSNMQYISMHAVGIRHVTKDGGVQHD